MKKSAKIETVETAAAAAVETAETVILPAETAAAETAAAETAAAETAEGFFTLPDETGEVSVKYLRKAADIVAVADSTTRTVILRYIDNGIALDKIRADIIKQFAACGEWLKTRSTVFTSSADDKTAGAPAVIEFGLAYGGTIGERLVKNGRFVSCISKMVSNWEREEKLADEGIVWLETLQGDRKAKSAEKRKEKKQETADDAAALRHLVSLEKFHASIRETMANMSDNITKKQLIELINVALQTYEVNNTAPAPAPEK